MHNKAINYRQQAGWELRLLRSRRPVIAALCPKKLHME